MERFPAPFQNWIWTRSTNATLQL